MDVHGIIALSVIFAIFIGCMIFLRIIKLRHSKIITTKGEGYFIYKVDWDKSPYCYSFLVGFSMPGGACEFKTLKENGVFDSELIIFRRKAFAETVINSADEKELKIGYRHYDPLTNHYFSQY